MRANTTKAKLKAHQTVVGALVRYADATLAEVLGYQGWDFLMFDAEHAPLEPRDLEQLVRAAERRDVTPLVRVTTNTAPVILRFMDTGVHGAHVPWVNSAEEAEQVVRSIKYHPRGIRGLAGVRAADYGQAIPLAQYVEEANAQTLVVIHVETAEAVDDLPRIVEVDGLDVIFIGRTDLSQSLGVPGQPQHPKLLAAVDRVVETVARSNLALGVLVSNLAEAREWQARGARYILISVDSLLTPAARQFTSAVRAGT